jgi:hypothetical protein
MDLGGRGGHGGGRSGDLNAGKTVTGSGKTGEKHEPGGEPDSGAFMNDHNTTASSSTSLHGQVQVTSRLTPIFLGASWS